jgi:phosphoheptose isomerase
MFSGNDVVAAPFSRSCEALDRAAREAGLRATICAIAEAITQTFRNGGKILIAGNGGSTGDGQRDLAAYCDHRLAAPSGETPLIQQIHIVAVHAICGLVESDLFGDAVGAAFKAGNLLDEGSALLRRCGRC